MHFLFMQCTNVEVQFGKEAVAQRRSRITVHRLRRLHGYPSVNSSITTDMIYHSLNKKCNMDASKVVMFSWVMSSCWIDALKAA